MAVILGIESSCDDTSASICKDGTVLSNVITTQEIHKEWGGVVPELASRAHQQNIVPVVMSALKKAGCKIGEIDAVAFTNGPGLLGPLLVANSFSKGLAMANDIPIISINHMEAHIHAHFIDDPKPEFPFLCLTVSGGHTQIVRINSYFEMELIGQTLDDAAGEAFDKSAKILGLDYPGGPEIDCLAQKGEAKFPFPEPKIQGCNYSFSGLKTSILYFIRDRVKEDPDFIKNNIEDLCKSIQDRIVSILLSKLRRASRETGIRSIAIAGGVSANTKLRSELKKMAEKNNWQVFIPKLEYCTDNAAMIAISGYFKFLENKFDDFTITPNPRLKIGRNG